MTITAYTYEADTHCIACTRKRFFNLYKSVYDDAGFHFWSHTLIDSEGNHIHPIFSTDEWQEYDPSFLADNPTQYLTCSDCLEVIEEYTHIN
tara:strand:- start:107 stop:382 length:276 start_codon:yes stop_codon:yes gene_type:complete